MRKLAHVLGISTLCFAMALSGCKNKGTSERTTGPAYADNGGGGGITAKCYQGGLSEETRAATINKKYEILQTPGNCFDTEDDVCGSGKNCGAPIGDMDAFIGVCPFLPYSLGTPECELVQDVVISIIGCINSTILTADSLGCVENSTIDVLCPDIFAQVEDLFGEDRSLVESCVFYNPD